MSLVAQKAAYRISISPVGGQRGLYGYIRSAGCVSVRLRREKRVTQKDRTSRPRARDVGSASRADTQLGSPHTLRRFDRERRSSSGRTRVPRSVSYAAIAFGGVSASDCFRPGADIEPQTALVTVPWALRRPLRPPSDGQSPQPSALKVRHTGLRTPRANEAVPATCFSR